MGLRPDLVHAHQGDLDIQGLPKKSSTFGLPKKRSTLKLTSSLGVNEILNFEKPIEFFKSTQKSDFFTWPAYNVSRNNLFKVVPPQKSRKEEVR